MDKSIFKKIKEEQIDKDLGKKPLFYFAHTYLSINKIHAVQLGVYIGIISALLFTYIHPIIGVLFLTDVALASFGVSVLSILPRFYIPVFAYIFTIRKNPWWYLNFLILSFGITLLFL